LSALGSRSPSGGFTLLELMLVLLVLVMAYGLAGPLLGDGSVGLDMRSAARQLSAGLRKARSLAVSEQRESALVVDLEKKTFSLSNDTRVYPLPPRLEVRLFTAQSQVIDAQSGAIRFFPDGSSTGGRISVGVGNDWQEVDVDWLTGRARVL
jgi:general secretion pathway protein H